MSNFIRYNLKDQIGFQKAIRQAVDTYFESSQQSIKSNRLMHIKMTILFIWMASGYVLLLSSNTAIEVFINYQIFGFGALLFALTVAHDASHQAVFEKKWLNRLFSYSWNLVGVSAYFWEIKHHEAHHNFTNVIDYDTDVSQTKLIRLNPKTEYLWFHRYQNWYVFLIYFFFGPITLLIREFRLYTIKRYGNTLVEHPPFTLLRVVVMKIGYFAFALGVPALFIPLPFWTIFMAFWAMTMICGIYTILVLAAPHINSLTFFKVPNEKGVLNTNWYNHILEVTLDTSPKSHLLNWLTGGLNTHIAHHLFPNICHIHYYNLSPIIEQVAKEYGVTYRTANLRDTLKGHFGLINELRLPNKNSGQRVIPNL